MPGGACDPARPMPAPAAPVLRPNAITARWLGQDRAAGASRGNLHVALAGLPLGQAHHRRPRSVTRPAATGLGRTPRMPCRWPSSLGRWPPRRPVLPAVSGRVRCDPDAAADVCGRNHDAGPVSRRTVRSRCAQGALPAPASVLAHPGDDLQALAARFGAGHARPWDVSPPPPAGPGHADHDPGNAGGRRPFFAGPGRLRALGQRRRDPPQQHDAGRLCDPLRRADPLGRGRQPRRDRRGARRAGRAGSARQHRDRPDGPGRPAGSRPGRCPTNWLPARS